MVFNSLNFIFFLLIVFIAYFLTPIRYRYLILLFSSCIYIYLFGWSFLLIVLSLIVLNYFTAKFIDISRERNLHYKIVFIAAIALNIAVLGFFKYYSSFTAFVNYICKIFNNNISEVKYSILFPLGISYYIFQMLGYNIEVYRQNEKAEKNFLVFATYILFFPKFLAGPVERSNNFIKQLHYEHEFNLINISEGLKLMLWGFFKKLVIADRLSIYVNAIFNNSEQHSGSSLALAAVFYVVQLYADFSGYTDIALGTANIFGFKLTQNFQRPFFAKSITEFWRKWHISLTSWVKDYIFKPLSLSIALNKNWGIWGVILALSITFLIVGIWHGSTLGFVIFGLLQSIALSFEVLTKQKRKKYLQNVPEVIVSAFSMIYVFLFFSFSCLFMRVNDASRSLIIVKKIFTNFGNIYFAEEQNFIYSILAILLLFTIDFKIEYFKNISFFRSRNYTIRYLSYVFIAALILLFGVFDKGQFIYFQY